MGEKDCKRDEYLGKHFFTKFGSEFVVIEYKDASYVKIQFVDNPNIIKPSCVHKIRTQKVPDPFYDNNGNKRLLPISTGQDYVGAEFKMKNGFTIKIDAYHDARHLEYHFVEFPDVIGITALTDIKHGYIKCPYQLNESGGYLGVGPFNSNDIAFDVWRGVIERGNNHKLHNYRLKQSGRNSGTYDNCELDPAWLNFQRFAFDYHLMYDWLNHNYKYQIDKDLLYPFYKIYTKGKHYYSNATCVLLPEELNKALVIPKLYRENFTKEKHKTYKIQKEQRIKELNEYYWNLGCILPNVYVLLQNYNVDLYL